jgi:predicted SprT family Zn-dependent metalloprotease
MTINFPTPPRREQSDPEPEKTTNEMNEPKFGDDLSKPELKAAIEEYQFWVVEEYPLEIDFDGIPVEVSTKLKRTAGKVAHIRGSKKVKHIRYAWKAYQTWGWEKFTETIRHELIHVHTVQNHAKGGHGHLFKRMVPDLDTTRHCESFSDDEAKYVLSCSECEKEVARRFRKSKTVKRPEKYRSKCCKAPLHVQTL